MTGDGFIARIESVKSLKLNGRSGKALAIAVAVSYTHLDVYKRQALQHALNLVQASHDARKRLHQALKDGSLQPAPGQDAIEAGIAAGILDAEQGQRLQAAEAARRRVIDVDDFAKEELKLSRGTVR